MAAKDSKILKDVWNALVEKCGMEKMAVVGAGTIAAAGITFVVLMVGVPNNFLDNKEEF